MKKKRVRLLVPKKAVDQFQFFIDRNIPSTIKVVQGQAVTKKNMYRLAGDICAFMRYFMHTQSLVEYVEKTKRMVQNKSADTASISAARTFLRRLGRVSDFYEFHTDTDRPIRDQRLELLRKLRRDTITLIKFLQTRVRA
jgi:hypothetical protein